MEIAEKKEKPFWETDRELFWAREFSGPAADLMKLPVGTVFHVRNGGWDGAITEKDGRKAVWVFATDKDIPINETNRYGLSLEDVKLPKERENAAEGEKDGAAEQKIEDEGIEIMSDEKDMD